MIVELGDWTPDQPDLGGQGVTVAKNVIPYLRSYKSFPSMVEYSGAISGYARGFKAITDKDGNAFNYAADESSLYRLADTTWRDATRTTSGNYQTATQDVWEFAQWGERIIATNFTNDIQVLTAGLSNFASLAGTPPKARHMAVVRDFLVLGNVTDFSTGAAVANRVHWSGFNNVETYEPAASTQADFQDLQGEGGWVQKVIGGEYGIIFQERAIWRQTYVGSPLVFQFDEVERGRGTPFGQSVVNYGSSIFYLGHDDFYMFNGYQSTPIGTNKIFQTFTADFDSTYGYRMSTAIDPVNTLVLWAYAGVGNVGGTPNKILIYNWALQRWSIVEENVELISKSLSQGYTLEGLDAVNTSIDALPFSLDSKAWIGGALSLIGFDSSHKMNTFDGSAMSATIETNERQLIGNSRALIVNTRPLVDGGAYSIQVGSRNILTDSVTYTATAGASTAGECPVFSEGRYHRFRLNVSGNFSDIQGIEVDTEKQGRY